MSVEPPRRELSAVEPSPGLREALDAARHAGPGPQRLAAAREALLLRATGVDPTLALQGARAANASNATQAASASLKASGGVLGKMILGAFAGAALSAAVVWNLAATETHRQPSVQPRTPVHVETEPMPAPVLHAPDVPKVPVTPEPATSLVSPSVGDDAPERTRARPRHKPRNAGRARPLEAPARDPRGSSTNALRREVSLLSLARDTLQDRPAETLRLTAEHARLFPQGRFVQEREVLAVHALLRRGRREEGVERGERFLKQYPHSTHAQRVAGLLEGARR